MDPRLRVVTRLPLDELWNEQGEVKAQRGADLTSDEVAGRLRVGCSAVVATSGEPLQWLNGPHLFEWWKSEAKPRLLDAEQEEWRLDELPDERGWRASAWALEDGSHAVCFEEYH